MMRQSKGAPPVRALAACFMVLVLTVGGVLAAAEAINRVYQLDNRTIPSTVSQIPLGPLAADETLSSLSRWIGIPLESGAPITSSILGVAAPPTHLVALYGQRAAASSHAFQDALRTWNDVLNGRSLADLFNDPNYHLADELPTEAQAAIAILLYALADATTLQAQALERVPDDDRDRILRLPLEVAQGDWDSDAGVTNERLEALHAATQSLDLAKIRSAGELLAAATGVALPTLRAWAESEEQARQDRDEWMDRLRPLLDRHAPGEIQEMDPIERIDVLIDVMRTAAAWQGKEPGPTARPLLPDMETPLRSALSDVIARLRIAFPADALQEELERANSLPRGLQEPLALILVNYVGLLDAQSFAEAAGFESPGSNLLQAQLRLLNAVRTAAPTLEAWGLVLGHRGAPFPQLANGSEETLHQWGRFGLSLTSEPDQFQLAQLVSAGGKAWGASVQYSNDPEVPRLDELVLRLYSNLGLLVNEGTRVSLARAAQGLPVEVERATAGALNAQLAALEGLNTYYSSLTVEDWERLREWSDPFSRVAGGWVSVEDLQDIRKDYAVMDKAVQAYYQGAWEVASAVDAASARIHEYYASAATLQDSAGWSFAPTAPDEPDKGDVQGAPYEGMHPPLPPPPSAATQCREAPPITRCVDDIWFIDPVLETVVISGFASTVYDPSEMGKDITIANPLLAPPLNSIDLRGRRQMLSLDLGGNDVYRNNAGGAFPTVAIVEGPLVPRLLSPKHDPSMVAVAIDFGGNDRYETPPSPFAVEGIQGSGSGGIGFLLDWDGDDRYSGDIQAQGYGGGYGGVSRSDLPCNRATPTNSLSAPFCTYGPLGIGMLVDAHGNDHYQATEKAQASTGRPDGLGTIKLGMTGSLGILVDIAGADSYRLKKATTPSFGQGAGEAGLALLLDLAGGDRYEFGAQGMGRALGVGSLVDLAGTDYYSRTHAQTGTRFSNNECWTSLRSPREDSTQDPPTGPFWQDAVNVTDEAQGIGLFIDVQGGGSCTLDPSPVVPDEQHVVEFVQEFATAATKDADADRWPDRVESPTWAPGDGSDYPAGLPREPPQNWPPDQPYPPRGADGKPLMPAESQFLVRIPAVFALADGSPTVYARGVEHSITVDLGGADLYLNQVGRPQSLGLDFGDGRDAYIASDACAHGCDGLLLDLGGNDFYQAPDRAQGFATRPGLGLLFDADGDDVYRIPNGYGQGTIQAGDVISGGGIPQAIFMDPAGDDRYEARTQGSVAFIQWLVLWSDPNTSALFFDLSGDDVYQPANIQGEVVRAQNFAKAIAAFVDADGEDRYVGRPGQLDGPDFSSTRNNQVRVSGSRQGPAIGQADHAAVSLRVDQGRMLTPSAQTDSPGVRFVDLGIAIGTTSDEVYEQNLALLVDPGGDDTYRNNAGSTLLGQVAGPGDATTCNPCTVNRHAQDTFPIASLLLDFSGDDQYENDDDGASSGRSLRPDSRSLPFDRNSGILRQGAGFLGVGILMDDKGNDLYRGQGLSQGFGLLGTGILWDRNGDDSYGLDPRLSRLPALDGDLTAWEEFEAGRWLVKARQRSDPCSYAVVPAAEPGPAASPVVRGSQVLLSVYNATLDVWRVVRVSPTLSSCTPTGGAANLADAILVAGPAVSNQLHPAFGEKDVFWQDDRGGDFDIYKRDMVTGTDPPTGRMFAVGPRGTNQTRPHATSNAVVWQDDRAGNWDIYAMDRASRVVRAVTSSPLDDEQPKVSATFIVWQTRSTAGDWDIAVHHRPSNETYIQRVPHDQIEPTVSGGRILYTERSGPGSERVFEFRWTGRASLPVMADASSASLDPDDPDLVAWISTAGVSGSTSAPAGSPYWETWAGDLRQPIKNARRSMLADRIENRFLQGSAWQAGLGWLLDEAGIDAYNGGLQSQGASFSTGSTTPSFGQLDSRVTDFPSYGVIVDLDGNDRYTTRREGQGAHVGILAMPVEVSTTGPPVTVDYLEYAHNTGFLLDLRGADVYVADARSQGYASLALGANLATITPAPGMVPPVNIAPMLRQYLVQSVGVSSDFGGTDEYVYGGSPEVTRLEEAAEGGQCTAPLDQIERGINEPTDAESANNASGSARDSMNETLQQDPFAALLSGFRTACNEVQNAIPDEFGGAQDSVIPPMPGRNNAVWQQKPRPDPGGPIAERANTRICATPCPPVVNVGGIGWDVPVIDDLEVAIREFGQRIFVVSIRAKDPTGAELTQLADDVSLVATIQPQDTSPPAFRVERSEFFLNGIFHGYGKSMPPHNCSPLAVACYSSSWKTDSEAYPDGDYAIRVRVHFNLMALGGTTLGFAEATSTFTVDNLPRILQPSVDSTLFSPFPYAADAPSHPTVGFRLSTDPRVPDGDGWVRLSVFNPAGDVIRVLRDFSDGPIKGVFAVRWDGLIGEPPMPVPSGRYDVLIEAVDDPAATRISRHAVTVEVDADPPRKGCIRVPARDCNDAIAVNIGNVANLDLSTGVATFELAFSSNDPTETFQRAHVFVVDDGTTAWSRYEVLRGDIFPLGLREGDRKVAVVLLEDLAGNLECAPACGHRVNSTVPKQAADSADLVHLEMVRDRKVNLGVFDGDPTAAQYRVDLVRPKILDDQLFEVEGRRMTIEEKPRVGAASDLTLRFSIHETSSKPVLAQLLWQSQENSTLRALLDVPLSPNEGDANLVDATWAAWPQLVTSLAADGWPEGAVTVSLLASDAAGNTAVSRSGVVNLDRTPPRVLESTVDYPDGREHGEAGDKLSVSVKAEDPPLLGAHTPNRELRVRIDASAVSGTLGSSDLPLRYDAAADAFRIDELLLDPPQGLDVTKLRAQQFPLHAKVEDVAGNLREAEIPVILGRPQLNLTLAESVTDAFNATLHWTTERPARAHVEYALEGEPFQRTLETQRGLNHTIQLEGLQASARYVYRVVALDDTGAIEAKGGLEFRTLSGLRLVVQKPKDGEILSGLFPLQLESRVDSKPSAEPRITVRLFNPKLPDGVRTVADALVRGPFRLDLVTDALPDGLYDLKALAVSESESVTVVRRNLLVDNTPPSIQFLLPNAGAVLAQPPQELKLLVRDALTPLNLSSLRVRIDGQDAPGILVSDAANVGNETSLLVVTGLPPLPTGTVRIEALIDDAAGNPGANTVRIYYDPESPLVGSTKVDYGRNRSAAQPGQTLRINIPAKDASGVVSASVRIPALGVAQPLQLQPTPTGFAVELTVPADASEGTATAIVRLLDRAGNELLVETHVRIDRTPPRILEWATFKRNMTSAYVVVITDETASVNVRASPMWPAGVDLVVPMGDELEALERAWTSGRATLPPVPPAFVRLNNLEPGTDYALEIHAVDTAGHATASETQWRFVPVIVAPPPILDLRVSLISSDAVRLAWNVSGTLPEQAVQFIVFRSNGTIFLPLGTVWTPTFTDSGLPAGREYQYFIQAQNLEQTTGQASSIIRVELPRQPVLRYVEFHPHEGIEGATNFEFTTLVESSQDAEPIVWLVISGRPYQMERADSGQDCRLECQFILRTFLPALDARTPESMVHVEVFDGGSVLRFPSVGDAAGPLVLANLDPAADASGAAAPGLSGLIVATLFAIVGQIWRRRQ